MEVIKMLNKLVLASNQTAEVHIFDFEMSGRKASNLLVQMSSKVFQWTIKGRPYSLSPIVISKFKKKK